jgi:hypothetical protein
MRLLSLAEIVKPFHPAIFIKLTDMLRSRGFLVPAEIEGDPESKKRGEDFRVVHTAIYIGMEANCLEAGLKASAISARKLKEAAAKIPTDTAGARELINELLGRLVDEMMATTFFSISDSDAEYFREPRKGWEAIIDRFPNTVSDIEESRKCFALSRYPAAVFHSLQVIEAGLIELGTFISVADPKSGFSAVEKKLTAILATERAKLTDFEKQNFDFLEQIQGTVAALKNAWRNKISHVQGRLALMTTDFSPEIAEEILFATRAFMRRLMEGLPTTRP